MSNARTTSSLRDVTDQDLLDGIIRLEARQRDTMAAIIEHLVELEQRRMHLSLGYSSLYEYCRRALGLSEDEAYRRITVAKIAARFPEVLAGLAEGALGLTQLVLLKPHLLSLERDATEEASELLQLARGSSKRTLERLLAARFPDASPRRRDRVRPLAPGRYRLEAELSEDTLTNLHRAFDLLGHTNPRREVDAVLRRALELLVVELERAKRGRRAEQKSEQDRAARKAAAPLEVARSTTPQPPHAMRPKTATPCRAIPRAVPRAVRRLVFERDGERCSFVGSGGRRCECREGLEIDHLVPWSLVPSHHPAGHRVLCRAHNRLEAERWFGRDRVSDCSSAEPRRPGPAAEKTRVAGQDTEKGPCGRLQTGGGEAVTLLIVGEFLAKSSVACQFPAPQLEWGHVVCAPFP